MVGLFLRAPHDAFKVPRLVPNLCVSHVDSVTVKSEQRVGVCSSELVFSCHLVVVSLTNVTRGGVFCKELLL